MIDQASARGLIAGQLALMPPPQAGNEWMILDEHTIERCWGWVFFYDSRRHQETGDFRLAIAGNSPYFVRRADGGVFVSGTALPVEDYIADFESGGRLASRCA